MLQFHINKLVNRPFEYKGFKGMYVYKSLGLLTSALFTSIFSVIIVTESTARYITITVLLIFHFVLILRNRAKSEKYNNLQRNKAKSLMPKRLNYRGRKMFYKSQLNDDKG